MAEQPLVTIAVPTHNLAPYLLATLASIQAQTITDFEVWVIDDHSSDTSGAIAQQVAAEDPRFHVLVLPQHAGVSVARNTAIDHATGINITFVDGDDRLAPNFLAVLLDGMAHPGAVLASVGYSWGQRTLRGSSGSDDWRQLSHREMFAESNRHGSVVGGYVWNKLFSLAEIRAQHLRFDESLTLAEDLWFTAEYVAASHGTYWSSSVVAYEKVSRPDSTIHTATWAMRSKEQEINQKIAALGRTIHD